MAAIAASGYRALPNKPGSLKLLAAFGEGPDDDARRLSLRTADASALVRVRVKTRPFLELVGNRQSAVHELPADRIPDLNRLISEAIEVV